MFAVTVEFNIKAEFKDEFLQAMHDQAENSLKLEEPCRYFDVCVSEDNANHIFLYELYDDRSAFDEHLASEHFKTFDAQIKDWVNNKIVKTWLR